MNRTQIGLSVVLVAFVGFTDYALWTHGYIGLFAAALANAATTQVLLDLVIALSLFLFWMLRDARGHGINPLPYAVLTMALGSIGALIYLIRRAAFVTTSEAAR